MAATLEELEELIPGTTHTRSDVAMPAQPGGDYRPLDDISRAVVHWTTGDALGVTDTGRWVKNIRDYHVGSLGWADIGYNYLVDRFGNVFTGRGRYRVGAHARGHNHDSLGIAYLGGKDEDITKEGKIAIIGIIEWVEMDVGALEVYGHRDLGNTICPGNKLWSWVQDGQPDPRTDEDNPPHRPPSEDDKPDYVVAVLANNPIDEGMARVLGEQQQWRFLGYPDADRDYIPPAPDTLGDTRLKVAVRVGAMAGVDLPNWEETYDLAGSDRAETARKISLYLDKDVGDSRNIT